MKKTYTVHDMVVATNWTVNRLSNLLIQYKMKPVITDDGRYQYSKDDYNKIIHHIYVLEHAIKPSQAEIALKLKGSVIYRWLKNGDIEATKLNNHYFFMPDQYKKLKQKVDQYQKQRLSGHQVNALAQKYSISIKNMEQILRKTNLYKKPIHDRELKILKPYIQNLKTRTKVNANKRQAITNGQLPESKRVYLQDLAKQLNVEYRRIYNMGYKNYIKTYKDPTNHKYKIYTDQKSADWVLNNYKKYPDTKLYQPKELVKPLGLSLTRIHTLLNLHHEKLIQVLGDDKRYVTQEQVDQLPIWHKQHRIRKSPTRPKIEVNTDRPYDPKTDLTAPQLANHFVISTHMVIDWVRSQRVNYHYDQNQQLYFTNDDIKKIKHAYLNYPEPNMVNNQALTKWVAKYPITLTTVLKYTKIKAHKVLGDNRNLFTQDQVKTIKNYVLQHYR